jgi:UDP-glucose 4-epimerase
VLVTGGAGFVGSHAVRLLCEQGFNVTVVDDLSFGHAEFVDPRALLVRGSFNDTRLLQEHLPGCSVVMHFAASSIIQFAFERPTEYFQNNLMKGIALLEAMREYGVRRIVFSSTASVYGDAARVPIHEDDPKLPTQAYGASKLAFESALSAYFHAYGIQSVSFRYFNAYGPCDEQRPVTRAVPRWVRAALADQPLQLFWDGVQIRDYVYVEDIARAHLLACELDGCRIYNLGSGHGEVMRDVAHMIATLTGSRAGLINSGERPGDPRQLIADTTRIRSELGWRPQVDLREGMRRTVQWYAERDALASTRAGDDRGNREDNYSGV